MLFPGCPQVVLSLSMFPSAMHVMVCSCAFEYSMHMFARVWLLCYVNCLLGSSEYRRAYPCDWSRQICVWQRVHLCACLCALVDSSSITLMSTLVTYMLPETVKSLQCIACLDFYPHPSHTAQRLADFAILGKLHHLCICHGRWQFRQLGQHQVC